MTSGSISSVVNDSQQVVVVEDPSERGILDQLEEVESDYDMDYLHSDEKYAKAAVRI